jgi:hypothetical protein
MSEREEAATLDRSAVDPEDFARLIAAGGRPDARQPADRLLPHSERRLSA